MEYFFMVKFVNKSLKLDICPDEAMVRVLEQNMGNHRFVWNNILARYNDLYRLFKTNNCPLNPTISNLNAILKILKQEYPFLRKGESTSQQQMFRDLNKAFTKFFNKKAGYPRFKSKKNPVQSFQNTKKRRKYKNNK